MASLWFPFLIRPWVPPVNIPIQPLKSVLTWVVHLPQNGTIGFEPWPFLHMFVAGARDAGNEKWNDPEKNHPSGGFL